MSCRRHVSLASDKLLVGKINVIRTEIHLIHLVVYARMGDMNEINSIRREHIRNSSSSSIEPTANSISLSNQVKLECTRETVNQMAVKKRPQSVVCEAKSDIEFALVRSPDTQPKTKRDG